jgi:hypothetical protein
MDTNVVFASKLFVLVVLLLYNLVLLDTLRNWTSLLVNPGLYFTVISHNITFFRMHFFHECIFNSAYVLLYLVLLKIKNYVSSTLCRIEEHPIVEMHFAIMCCA